MSQMRMRVARESECLEHIYVLLHCGLQYICAEAKTPTVVIFAIVTFVPDRARVDRTFMTPTF